MAHASGGPQLQCRLPLPEATGRRGGQRRTQAQQGRQAVCPQVPRMRWRGGRGGLALRGRAPARRSM
eukprot:10650445-Lingulodinium_polyedra.AAC.1